MDRAEMCLTKMKVISTGSFAENVEIASKSDTPCVVPVQTNVAWFEEFRDRVPVELKETGVRAYTNNGAMWEGEFYDLWEQTMGSPGPSDLYMTDTTLGRLPGNLSGRVPNELTDLNLLRHLEKDERPDWLWYMVGGMGSFSPRHVDTGASGAWNALLFGRKEWKFGNCELRLRKEGYPRAYSK